MGSEITPANSLAYQNRISPAACTHPPHRRVGAVDPVTHVRIPFVYCVDCGQDMTDAVHTGQRDVPGPEKWGARGY